MFIERIHIERIAPVACMVCLWAILAGAAHAQTPVGTDIRNHAWGAYELRTGDRDTSRSDTTTTTVTPPSGVPRLVLDKRADRATAAPGTEIAYTLIIANEGTTAATSVLVVDTLPTGTSFSSASSGGSAAGGVVTWNIASLPIAARDTLSLMVRVDATMISGTVRNQASARCYERSDTLSNVVTTTITGYIATELGLLASPRAVAGNGRDSALITATITDAAGAPPVDGTIVLLRTTHGSFADGADTISVGTAGGSATAVLRSEVVTGATISSTVHGTFVNAAGRTLHDSVPVAFFMGAVAGRIHSATAGTWVAGIHVQLFDADVVVGDDTTDDDGGYIIPVSTRGAYTIVATYTNSFGDRTEVRFSVFAEASPTSGVAASNPENGIAGYVLDRSSTTPIRESGIRVVVRALGASAGGQDLVTTTNTAGFYSLDGMAPGRYEITVDDPRYRGSATVNDTAAGALMLDAHVMVAEIPHLEITIAGTKRIVEIGDAVGYTMTVTNKSRTLPLVPTWIADTLPPGFGYAADKAILDSLPAGGPMGTGRVVRWNLPDTLRPMQSVTLRAMAIVGPSAIDGDGVHHVQAAALGIARDTVWSLPASATVIVRPGVFTDHAIVLGRVFYDADGDGVQDRGEAGVAGVELWMEDGTRVVTGDAGTYSLPDVVPGDRVLRINTLTLPRGSTLVAHGSAFAGDARSRFVVVTRGGVARADFAVMPPSQMSFELLPHDAAIDRPDGTATIGYVVRQHAATGTSAITLRDTLPAGLAFDLTSVTINDSVIALPAGRTRSLLLQLQHALHGGADTIRVRVVADSDGVGRSIEVRPHLHLIYPTGPDMVISPRDLSFLSPGPVDGYGYALAAATGHGAVIAQAKPAGVSPAAHRAIIKCGLGHDPAAASACQLFDDHDTLTERVQG